MRHKIGPCHGPRYPSLGEASRSEKRSVFSLHVVFPRVSLDLCFLSCLVVNRDGRRRGGCGALLFGCCDTLCRLTLDRLYPAHPARSVAVVEDDSTVSCLTMSDSLYRT